MLKQIQKSLGSKETGLAEFKERDAAAASAPLERVRAMRHAENRFAFWSWHALLAWPAARLAAADKVKLVQGNQSSGKITEITPTELVLELGATKKRFPVNDVDWIQFDARAERPDAGPHRRAARAHTTTP